MDDSVARLFVKIAAVWLAIALLAHLVGALLMTIQPGGRGVYLMALGQFMGWPLTNFTPGLNSYYLLIALNSLLWAGVITGLVLLRRRLRS